MDRPVTREVLTELIVGDGGRGHAVHLPWLARRPIGYGESVAARAGESLSVDQMILESE